MSVFLAQSKSRFSICTRNVGYILYPIFAIVAPHVERPETICKAISKGQFPTNPGPGAISEKPQLQFVAWKRWFSFKNTAMHFWLC